MNTEQLTKLASFAGKSANDFWVSTGKKPTDVIAGLALALIEANGKVQALTLENEEMRKIIDAVTDLDNEPQYNEPGMGCGIEDHGYQRDGYLACRYGWHEAMDRIYSEVIPRAEELSFPATGAAVAQIEARVRDEVIDWFETEIMAIDPAYRGSPSYTHDGYDIKHKALELVTKVKAAFDAECREEKWKATC